MKLENKEFGFDSFATEMARLKNEKHFDYLVTVVIFLRIQVHTNVVL